jgi:hypothetical protein
MNRIGRVNLRRFLGNRIEGATHVLVKVKQRTNSS